MCADLGSQQSQVFTHRVQHYLSDSDQDVLGALIWGTICPPAGAPIGGLRIPFPQLLTRRVPCQPFQTSNAPAFMLLVCHTHADTQKYSQELDSSCIVLIAYG